MMNPRRFFACGKVTHAFVGKHFLTNKASLLHGLTANPQPACRIRTAAEV